MSALLPIGEFARRCRLPVSTLRFYHQIGLLIPASVDPDSGYRRYGRDQLPTAVLVARLREFGLPPTVVHRVLAGGASGAAALREQRRRLQAELIDRMLALARLGELLEGMQHPAHAVRRVELPGGRVLVHSGTVPGERATRGVQALVAQLRRKLAGTAAEPVFGVFPLDLAGPAIPVTVCVALPDGHPHDELTTGELPQGPALATEHRGPYDGLPMAYGALLDAAAASGDTPTGPVVEEYLPGPGPVTRLSVPIRG